MNKVEETVEDVKDKDWMRTIGYYCFAIFALMSMDSLFSSEPIDFNDMMQGFGLIFIWFLFIAPAWEWLKKRNWEINV